MRRSKMTLGQVSDVTFLVLMPWFISRLGVKRMLLLGMLAWTVRFALFDLYATALTWPGLLYAAIAMHGICYDFFFVMGRIYVDRRAPEHLRATAQGLLAFVTLGAGMFAGTWLAGLVGELSSGPDDRWHHPPSLEPGLDHPVAHVRCGSHHLRTPLPR